MMRIRIIIAIVTCNTSMVCKPWDLDHHYHCDNHVLIMMIRIMMMTMTFGLGFVSDLFLTCIFLILILVGLEWRYFVSIWCPSHRLHFIELLWNWIILGFYELWNVLQDLFSPCKLWCIGCTGMVSSQCASSCAAANDQIECKRSCTGCTWTAFLWCASSSRELSNHQL